MVLIPEWKDQKILELAATGVLSMRAIGSLVGCSRQTVANVIAFGRVRPRRRKRQVQRRPGEVTFPDPAAVKIWCPDCGAWVSPPCHACQIRALRRGRRRPQEVSLPAGTLYPGFDLLPEEQARLEGVRFFRQLQKDKEQ